MSLSDKIKRLEAVLGAQDCPQCAITAERLNDTDEGLREYFAPCRGCGHQRTFQELVETADQAETL